MDGQTFKKQVEEQQAIENAIAKLAHVDRLHEERILKRAFGGAQELLQNAAFVDIMRLIFEFSNYDVNTLTQEVTQAEFQKLQGRREIWCMIRENILGNNPKALSLIEHHKQINRQNNDV